MGRGNGICINGRVHAHQENTYGKALQDVVQNVWTVMTTVIGTPFLSHAEMYSANEGSEGMYIYKSGATILLVKYIDVCS